MNKVSLTFSLFFLTGLGAMAQDLYRSTVPLHVTGTASLYISNAFTNESSSIYQNDATVTINGNITNKQTTAMTGTGLTNLLGTSSQQLLGDQTFVVDRILLNNTSAGTSNFVFNGTNNLNVVTSMDFTGGIVVTNTNRLIFNNLSTYSNASNTSHVNGYVQKTGQQAFTFPVGDGSTMRTAAITAPTNATDAFTGKYFLQNPNTPGYNTSNKDAVLDLLSTKEYWTIDRTVGASDVSVTLSWLDNATYNSFRTTAPGDYYIGMWNAGGSIWNSLANGGTTGTSASGTVISNGESTAFGPFALASRNIPLPVDLAYFKGQNTLEGNRLIWQSTSDKDSKYFEIEHSCNGTEWAVLGTVPTQKSTSPIKNYSLLDVNTCESTSYYKLSEYSTVGIKTEYSVIAISNVIDYTAYFGIYPNPNSGSFTVSVSGNAPQYDLELLDATGNKIMNYTLKNGQNDIQCLNLSTGMYLVRFKLNDKILTKKMVIN